MDMKKKIINILAFFVIIQPILDIYWLLEEPIISIAGVGISTVIRFLFVVIIGLLFLFVIKNDKKKWFYLTYGLLIIIYAILHQYFCANLITYNGDSYGYNMVNELFYIIRMVIPMIILIVASNLKFNDYLFNKIIDWIIYLTSFVIVFTNLFKISFGAYVTKIIKYSIIDWFYNIHASVTFYDTATRAYFSFANMISSLLFGLTFILIYRLLNKFNFKNVLFLFVQMLAMFMLGTKVSTYGFLISCIMMIFVYLLFFIIKKEKKFNFKSSVYLLLLIGIWYLIFPNSPCKNRISSDTINKTNAYANEEKEENIKQEKDAIKKIDKKTAYDFVMNNYKLFSLKENQIFEKYPLEVDPIFWFEICGAPANERIDNRFVSKKLLIRIKEVDGRKLYNYFGVGYTRMSGTIYLERDFLSQYYTLGIIGVLLFIGPYLISLVVSGIYMLLHKDKFNLKNTTIIIASGIGLCSTYFCGNSLDSLTFNIIYAFIVGYCFSTMFNKDKIKLNDKKITICALHLGVGGVEKYISSLTKMLGKDYDIEIISTYKVLDKPIFDYSNARIKYLINDKPYKNEFIDSIKTFNLIGIMKYGFKNLKIVLLKHFLEPQAINKIDSKYVITTIFHSRLVGAILDSDYIKIATEHNYHNNNNKYINKVIDSVNNFNCLVCVSEELRDFYKDRCHCKCVYIPNVINELPKIKNKKINNKLVTVGRLSQEKGYFDLIDIISIVKEEIPDIYLSIIGDGPLKEDLKNKIKDLKLQDNIKLLGQKDESFINKEMQESMLYTMTSYTESFGLVLIEAMSNKTACIAFDSANGAKKLLSHNNGILIKNRSNEDMAKKIVYYLQNSNKLNSFIDNSYKSMQVYLLDNVKNDWLKLLK